MASSPSSSVATSGAAIRQTFLDFYAAKGHRIEPSASLVPEDPTVLLTIAGIGSASGSVPPRHHVAEMYSHQRY
jgi:alanyl-tRNA synthetase